MVFTVEVVTGPTADLLARAQLDAMREICAWVAQQRAADAATSSEAANGAPGPVESD